MSDPLDTCFVCRKEIKEGDHLIATDDVTCTRSEGDEPRAFESWDNNPYRGVYCPSCWDKLMVVAREASHE